jgi:hypothetical protein
MGKRQCEEEGCSKGGIGSTRYCKAHGGGKRCQHNGCLKSAQGGTPHCKAHGGGWNELEILSSTRRPCPPFTSPAAASNTGTATPNEVDGAGASSSHVSHQGDGVHSASLKLPLQAGTFTVLGPPAPCWRRYWRWARSRQRAVRLLEGDDTGLEPGAVTRHVRQRRMLLTVAPSCPSTSPSTPPLAPKMHAFVHVLSSLNPTAPHHESTASTGPTQFDASACVTTTCPLSCLTPSGHSEAQRKWCMRWWRGRGCSAPFFDGLSSCSLRGRRHGVHEDGCRVIGRAGGEVGRGG